MNCRNCGNAGTLDMTINNVEFWICEHCKNSWSYKQGPEISEKELNRVQEDEMRRYMEEMKGVEPTRKTIGRMMEKKRTTNIRLYNPIIERDPVILNNAHAG